MSRMTPLEEYLTNTAAGRIPLPGLPAVGRLKSKLAVFWRFTQDLAGLSRCRRLRVGCTVTRPDLSEVLAIGYNGPPAGVNNDACRGQPGSCGCVHADANAVSKLRDSSKNLVMLLTHSPCEHCAGLIVNSGRVRYVVYGDDYRDSTGLELLASCRVTAVKASNILVPSGGSEDAGSW